MVSSSAPVSSSTTEDQLQSIQTQTEPFSTPQTSSPSSRPPTSSLLPTTTSLEGLSGAVLGEAQAVHDKLIDKVSLKFAKLEIHTSDAHSEGDEEVKEDKGDDNKEVGQQDANVAEEEASQASRQNTRSECTNRILRLHYQLVAWEPS